MNDHAVTSPSAVQKTKEENPSVTADEIFGAGATSPSVLADPAPVDVDDVALGFDPGEPGALDETNIETALKAAVDADIAANAPEARVDDGPMIKLTLETGGETYECETSDIAGAIASLGLKTTNTRTRIRAEYDGKVWERIFFVAYARRLFFQKITQLSLAKTIKLALNV